MFASDSEGEGSVVVGRISFVKSCVIDYFLLVKPWIIGLVLVSTLAGIFIAEGGMPPFGLVAGTLVGIGLATAAAASLNNYIDHDIDARMARTSKRPTASGAIAPVKALACGAGLTVASLVIMTYTTTELAAWLTGVSIFFYVIPYTLLMKRRTPLATFVGGIGGALPPVIGYAAAVPALDEKAFALFLVIYAWQHPHFWALALKYRRL
ncbi:MAG: UbiA family prenyltransferase, partial [Nitrospinae bacterium]|nr:UbiA family prenyltransferase [Nitrospinota bacterium]